MKYPTNVRLRHTITIEKDSTNRSASGGIQPWRTPEEVATVAAFVHFPRVGREIVAADWTTAIQAVEITIRWRGDITTKMRVRWDVGQPGQQRYFAIRQVPAGDRSQRFIEILCEEVKS